MEQRSHKGSAEVRQSPTGGRMIVGYAAVFDRKSSDMGFIETIDPGAFTKTIQEADVRGLGNHDVNWLLGRVKANTCRVSVDQIGLKYEIDVNETDPDGQRALAKVERGDWDGSSFSFNTIQDQWDWSASPPQRRLLEVALIDVGPVTFPAYPDATAAARALQPIADKRGLDVNTLVGALKTGEIRSLIDGGSPMNKPAEQRAVWTTEYMNDLPDSAFLYIADGGTKDSDGKTVPRTLRYFPYKDANGAIDLPHLRNALARIPQSDLPDDVQTELTAKAQKILAANTDAQSNSLTFGQTLDELESRVYERRVGKTISAKTASQIQGAIDSLRELLGGSEVDGDADDGTLLGQALEMDSINAAKEMDSASLIDVEMRMRMRELEYRGEELAAV